MPGAGGGGKSLIEDNENRRAVKLKKVEALNNFLSHK